MALSDFEIGLTSVDVNQLHPRGPKGRWFLESNVYHTSSDAGE
jgi:hypothetical protein